MKVGILTCFTSLSHTYSLVHAVALQIEMLLNHGYTVKLFVSETCSKEERFGIFLDSRIEWYFITNTYEGQSIAWIDYYNTNLLIPPLFWDQRDCIAENLYEGLKDLSLCFIHDVHYQGKHYIHHLALRKIQPQLPQLRFIAFTHSYPYPRPSCITSQVAPRYTPLPNTLYAYPTYSGLTDLATQYNVPEAYCHVVYHPTYTLSHPIVKLLHEKVDLFSPDLLVIYPTRLTTGKQLDKVISLLGALKLAGNLSVRLIFCDFSAVDTDCITYKNTLYETGLNYDLTAKEIIFTSDLGFESGLPHDVILELFRLSNIFICPSLSESFSLILLEAAAAGNFIIANENVPALRELGNLLQVYPMRWNARCGDYTILETYTPSEAAYYGQHAVLILKELAENRIFKAQTLSRKRFNPDWIWTQQLLPLMNEVTTYNFIEKKSHSSIS